MNRRVRESVRTRQLMNERVSRPGPERLVLYRNDHGGQRLTDSFELPGHYLLGHQSALLLSKQSQCWIA
jgi:hypothetical protein